MKKILFSCLLALGVGVNAQLDFSEDFEGDATGMIQFGGGGFNTVNYCSATTSGSLTYSATVTQTGWLANLLEKGDLTGQSNNGQKLDITFSYKKAANLTGTLYAAYAVLDDVSNLWSIVTLGTGVPLTATAVTTCGTVTGSIPAGTFDPNKTYAVGTWMAKTGTGVGALYVDDLIIKQAPATAVPACATFTSPTSGASVPGGTYGLAWTTSPTASSYKITIGTTPGASDVVNATVYGNTLNVALPTNSTYYAKVTATNTVGDATGCQEITFTTNSNVGHCGPITSTAPSVIAPIRSVTFAGVTNTSDPTPAGLGAFPVHQDFKNIEFPVKNDVTTLPLSIIGSNNATAANGWGMSVFIDWNNDGDFNDAGEAYFNTFETKVSTSGIPTTVPLTGNITIPAGTALGKRTMRIKYNFQSTAAQDINPALADGCANMTNGQVEDYTIDYQDALAVSDVTKAGISVYPNPFSDVLRISDVKGVKSVSVNDISGRQVKTLAPSAELNLSTLKSGLYIVNLQMEDGSVKSFKAIKK
ncbi:T9SS type A sorting domain-containing protein [Chryseobacterium sp. KACC 21268]|nr:T9SS type A sorting domain-containing protein [Chryseobacterium sp. KACC 21268]